MPEDTQLKPAVSFEGYEMIILEAALIDYTQTLDQEDAFDAHKKIAEKVLEKLYKQLT
jgi:hypothetical protein